MTPFYPPGRFWECALPINAQVDPLTHYILVRADLPVGAAAAQIVHAAGESSPGNIGAGTYAIVLSVPNELGFRSVIAKLGQSGLAWTPIFECDGPYAGQLMAIGVRPVLRSVGRKIFSSMPLYRGSAGVAQSSAPSKEGDDGSRPSPGTNCGNSSVVERQA